MASSGVKLAGVLTKSENNQTIKQIRVRNSTKMVVLENIDLIIVGLV